MCLLDKVRTLAFKEAIEATVKPGDVVIDVGSGSGIMALFAAQAGAGKVHAVEIDHSLADALRKTVASNNLKNVIEVIEDDAITASLPKNVNVLVAELVETGLIDEMQIPVINRLVKDGIIGETTKTIPSAYTTFVEPIYMEPSNYGFNILAPIHDWPFFHDSQKDNWSEIAEIESLAERKEISNLILNKENAHGVTERAIFEITSKKPVTAIRLSGTVWLRDGQPLGPTNTLNSDKIFHIDTVTHSGQVIIDISYKMGKGVKSLSFSCQST